MKIKWIILKKPVIGSRWTVSSTRLAVWLGNTQTSDVIAEIQATVVGIELFNTPTLNNIPVVRVKYEALEKHWEKVVHSYVLFQALLSPDVGMVSFIDTNGGSNLLLEYNIVP